MSIFLVALLVGALFHQLISIIQPIDNRSEYQIGRRVIVRFEGGAYVVWKAAAIAVAVVGFIVLATILVTQGIHPASGYAYQIADVATSPRMGAAVFGGLVGILLGNLLNRLLRKGSDYRFTSADRLELALIFALTILGIGGEEILRSSAQRVNKISLGTTTAISFADASPKSSRLSAEQPSGAFRNTQGKSGGSTGLQKLYDIGSAEQPNIDRDKQFIEVLARHEGEPVPDPANTGRVAEGVLSPIASCLSGISRLYGDDAFIDEQLATMSGALREIAGDGPVEISRIERKLSDVISEIAQYVRPRSQDFKNFMPQLDDREACNQILNLAFDAKPALTDASILDFRNSRNALPYVAMSYASVMAALHYYEAAAFTMDQWIRKHQHPAPKTVRDRWYLLRAELTQGLFMEEWIRDRGAAASSSLRKYHIDNLKAIVDGMRSFVGISSMSRRNEGYKWTVGLLGAWHAGDDGICDIPDLPKIVPKDPTKSEPDNLKPADATERMQTIYNTYLSAQKDYVDHSLKHPTVKVSSASLIESEVIGLMSRSLKCIKGGQSVTRAEHIERYVRSELNLLENTTDLKARDEVRNKIRDARQMLALAFQLIDVPVRKAKKEADEGPIQNRINTDPIVELYETLLATQGQLQSFSEREVTN